MPGQTQQLIATGTFNDGSTQTLQSVIWNSLNPSTAVISNSSGSAGIVNAQATGTTTLTATAGDAGGSASLSVAGLVSLTITPANPSIAVASGQQLAATGTFSDGSQHNITASVTWISSNTSIVVVGSTPGTQGFAIGAISGSATITAALGSIQASTSVSVQNSTTATAPNISSVSPPTGVAGIPVTISGTGFGATQGTGTVWLGSTYASVVSWSNLQIVATVASISTSGTAQVQQGGVLSNTVPFNVNTATILNLSAASGIPGTQVTITGSGFGATQGSGLVWLGTVNGLVQSWSDTQVIAVVASGSSSGNAQILQNGVISNAVPFAVNSLNITSVTPTSGGPGTSVTITGTGFGSTQGNGLVWLGGTNGRVVSWSPTQVVAVVAPVALTGVVRIEQNDVLSNAVSFTVPSSGGNAVTLIPNMFNLVVGQTQTIQALNSSGQSVTGLTWTSSNPNVVSLSLDDPPILTALTAGHITITAGTASADVTVFSTALPIGTVIWSNPGDGSGVTNVVPAVPSSTGVADVFAFQADGTVQAITSSGTTAWSANLNGASVYQTVPDFQGGLVVANLTTTQSITKLDGLTGQPYPAYTAATQDDSLSIPIIHTDGTIFTLDTYVYYSYEAQAFVGTISVVGINPITGAQIFSVPLNQSSTGTLPNVVGGSIVAGDGFYYVPYVYENITNGVETTDTVTHLMVMRVGTDGSISQIDVKDWDVKYFLVPGVGYFNTGVVPSLSVHMMTNANTGTVLSWEADTQEYCAFGGSPIGSCNYWVLPASTFGFASTEDASLAFSLSEPGLVIPQLQAQDGSFFGNDRTYSNMIHFDLSGKTLWSVPGDYPAIATADGGVIGYSGITYDSNGNATGEGALPGTPSWTEQLYQTSASGSVQSFGTDSAPVLAESFWGLFDGNQSLNLAAKLQGACPDSVTISSTTNYSLKDYFPQFKTGMGIVTAMQVNPPTNKIGGNWDLTPITESFTGRVTTCPSIIPLAKTCSPGSPFIVGKYGETEFGAKFEAEHNIFYDEHLVTNPAVSILSQPGAPNECTVTCQQMYSCGGKQIGAFTIVKSLTLGTIRGTPVTNVNITKTARQP
ncbi:MAG: IPT/TIG domain-containing protein [Terriglobales bacterium]|jgi:hypothetical protein